MDYTLKRMIFDRARHDRERDDYRMRDGRQGVRGTGRYGIGGSRYYGRHDYSDRDYDREREYDRDDDYRRDREYRDYNYDPRDYATSGGTDMRLTKDDMRSWKRMMRNADGTIGEHFDHEQISRVADQVGARYNGYDENELCMTANMIYSDYGEVLRAYIPKDKEATIYTKLAKAFLEDEDAPQGSEKLALYYYCIVKGDEE